MTTICEDLRKAVLQVAIQGKLTEQLPEDGNAEDLYKEIQAEKQKLIKEGKVKKEKPLPEITEKDIPFDIPENWKWCRLQDIATKVTDGTHHSPPNSVSGEYMYVSAKNIKNKGISLEDITYVTKKVHDEIYARCNPEYGDVLLIKDGATAGITTVNNLREPFSLLSSVALIKLDSGHVDPWFLVYALRSDLLYSIVREIMQGTGIPRITLKQIYPLVVPLPPLPEQKRIVARVDELMAKIDEMEATEKDITALYEAFPGDMKASLLQAAIQGKLTEQLPEDGNAEDLYNEIQAEKQRLIKEGKIKKEKPLPEIAENDIPFDIPGNWKWVYMGNIFSHNTGKALNQSNTDGTLLTYITTSNLYWEGFVLINLRSMKFTESELDKCTIRKGDLLVCEGGDVGRSAIWPYDFEMRIQNHIHKLRAYVDVCTKYYWYVIYLYKLSELIGGKGIGIQGLSSNALHKLIVPLPPLAEQKRIVEKLDQLLPLCDAMKADISGGESA